MKTATRPQYHRLRRILEMIRQGARTASPPNCGHFMRELEVSRRTVMRDLDFLRDDHHAPIAYDDSRKGYALTEVTFRLAPVELTRREVFSYLVAYHGNWYLLARNPAPTRMETFALSRCRSITGTGEHFARSADFDARTFFRDALGISQAEKPWKVRLLFDQEVATYFRERVWHTSQKLRDRRDGSLEVRLETSSGKELTRWILSWMPHVQVLAAGQLRDRMRERLRQGLARCG